MENVQVLLIFSSQRIESNVTASDEWCEIPDDFPEDSYDLTLECEYELGDSGKLMFYLLRK